jgi:23S rRNA (guanosine2251-2'-O)-methyltransferase
LAPPNARQAVGSGGRLGSRSPCSGQDMNDSTYIYGRNTVREALLAGRVRKVLMQTGATGVAAELQADARRLGVPVSSADRRELDRLAAGANHQGVVAEVSPFVYSSLDEILAEATKRGEPPFVLLLDCIQDPQNLGTLLRTAEAVGIHGVVIPRHRAAEVTPAVEKASAGAVEHLRIAQEANLTLVIQHLKAAGLWVAGIEDTPAATDYAKASLSGPMAIVVGSEGKGISRLVRESCDFTLRLPMRGKVTSLNAAVAGSVVLYEALKQRAKAATAT